MAAGVLGWPALPRTLTPIVSTAADIDNVVLPVWMLTLGIALFRARHPSAATCPAA